jgi:hypothetical protein
MDEELNLDSIDFADIAKSNVNINTLMNMVNSLRPNQAVYIPTIREGITPSVGIFPGIGVSTIKDSVELGKVAVNFISKTIDYFKENRYCYIKNSTHILKSQEGKAEKVFLLIEKSKVKIIEELEEYCKVEYFTVRSEESQIGWIHKQHLIFLDN